MRHVNNQPDWPRTPRRFAMVGALIGLVCMGQTNRPAATNFSIMPPLPLTSTNRLGTNRLGTNRLPAQPQNFVVKFPRLNATNLYSLYKTRDNPASKSAVWQLVGRNYYGGLQSTNADVYTTNRGGMEFWKFVKQTNFIVTSL